MKSKRVFISCIVLLLVFTMVFVVEFVAAQAFQTIDNVYFKLCPDSECLQPRTLYELKESPVVLKSFNAEGVVLSGEIISPDGTQSELKFGGWFRPDDIAKISLTELGIYVGHIKVSKEGYLDLDLYFEFRVVDHIKTYDLIPKECGDGDIDDGEECDEGVLNGALGSICTAFCTKVDPCKQQQPAVIFENQESDADIGNENLFREGAFSVTTQLNLWHDVQNENTIKGVGWQCPPAGVDVNCRERRISFTQLAYKPNATASSCGIAGEGNFSLNNYLSLIGIIFLTKNERQDVLDDLTREATQELADRARVINCNEGCTKQVEMTMGNVIEHTLPWPRVEVSFNYDVSCKQLEDVADWKIEGRAKEILICEGES